MLGANTEVFPKFLHYVGAFLLSLNLMYYTPPAPPKKKKKCVFSKVLEIIKNK